MAALTEPREGRSCAAALSVGVPLLCTPGGGHCITTSMGQELRSPQSMVSMKKPFGASTRAWVCFGLPHCKPWGAAPQIPQPLTSPVGGDDRWVDSMISSNLSDSVVLAASTRWNGGNGPYVRGVLGTGGGLGHPHCWDVSQLHHQTSSCFCEELCMQSSRELRVSHGSRTVPVGSAPAVGRREGSIAASDHRGLQNTPKVSLLPTSPDTGGALRPETQRVAAEEEDAGDASDLATSEAAGAENSAEGQPLRGWH